MIHAPLRTFEFAPELDQLCHAITILNYFSRKFKFSFWAAQILGLPFIRKGVWRKPVGVEPTSGAPRGGSRRVSLSFLDSDHRPESPRVAFHNPGLVQAAISEVRQRPS